LRIYERSPEVVLESEAVNQITDRRMRMAKPVDELFEAPEAEEQPAKKQNLHVVIAIRHLNKRRNVLLEKRAGITKEIEEIEAAILALE
jgi:hypothetical protein